MSAERASILGKDGSIGTEIRMELLGRGTVSDPRSTRATEADGRMGGEARVRGGQHFLGIGMRKY